MRLSEHTPWSLVACMIIALTACGNAPEDAPADAELPVWRTAETRVWGSLDQPGTSLTAIGSVAVHEASGRVYVGQPMERHIKVFDRRGRRVRTIGRPGIGPGEFQSVGALGFQGDTLWVIDWSQGRLTLFRPDGELIRVSRVGVDVERAGRFPLRVAAVLPDLDLLAMPGVPSQLTVEGTVTRLPLVHLAADGAVLDTAAFVGVAHRTMRVRRPDATGPRGFYVPQPFRDDGLYTVSRPDTTIVVVDREPAAEVPATFEVLKVRPDGDTVASRAVPYTPVAVSDAAVDSALAPWVDDVADRRSFGSPGRALAEEWVRAAAYIPPAYPPVSAVAVGDDGSVWLRREPAPGDTVTWLVLGPALSPRAEARIPAGLSVRTVRADAVWGVWHGRMDEPYLVRLQLERPR